MLAMMEDDNYMKGIQDWIQLTIYVKGRNSHVNTCHFNLASFVATIKKNWFNEYKKQSLHGT